MVDQVIPMRSCQLISHSN